VSGVFAIFLDLGRYQESLLPSLDGESVRMGSFGHFSAGCSCFELQGPNDPSCSTCSTFLTYALLLWLEIDLCSRVGILTLLIVVLGTGIVKPWARCGVVP
jgi:hypothetical protein